MIFIKIIRFVYLLIAYIVLAIFYLPNILLYKLFGVEMMFLFRWHSKVIELLNNKINETNSKTNQKRS